MAPTASDKATMSLWFSGSPTNCGGCAPSKAAARPAGARRLSSLALASPAKNENVNGGARVRVQRHRASAAQNFIEGVSSNDEDRRCTHVALMENPRLRR